MSGDNTQVAANHFNRFAVVAFVKKGDMGKAFDGLKDLKLIKDHIDAFVTFISCFEHYWVGVLRNDRNTGRINKIE